MLWYKQLNNTNSFFRKNAALDVSEDESIVYTTSHFPGSNPGGLPFLDNAHGYLLKVDADGVDEWINPIHTGQAYQSSQVKTADDGSVFLAGLYFGFRFSLRGTALSSERSPSYVLAKTDRDGDVQWAINLPDTSSYYGDITSMVVDEKNSRVLLMISQGLRNTTSSCFYQPWETRILSVDFDGNITWKKSLTGNDLTVGSSLSISPAGDIFVVGRYRGTLRAATYSIQSTKTTECPIETSFIWKMDGQGNTWSLRNLGTDQTDTYTIDFLADGTYVVSGTQVVEENATRYEDFPQPFPSNAQYVFLRHYDFAGNLLAEKTFNKGGSQFYHQNPIAKLDHTGSVVMSDRALGKFDTLTYSPNNGQLNLVLMRTSLGSFRKSYTDEDIANFIQLFPNPTSDRLVLKIWRELFHDQNFKMTMFNTTGQLVLEQSLDAQQDVFYFDTYNLRAGLYFVKLQNSEQRFVRKIVVLH